MGPCVTLRQANTHVSRCYTRARIAFNRSFAAVLLAFATQTAQANPIGGEVVSGSASFATNGDTLTIQATPDTVINWQSFSIGANETTNFVQSSTNSTVLNRVIGNDSLPILGTLTSNGNIFFANPSGVLDGWTTGAGFTPVGGTLTITDTGTTLDYTNHTISNLTINRYGGVVGLFGTGSSNSGGTISLTGSTEVGWLVGTNIGTISNSYASGSVNGSTSGGTLSLAGGLAGSNSGTISNSYANGSVNGSTSGGTISFTGSTEVGGLTGVSGGSITNSGAIAVTNEMITSWNGTTLINTGAFTLIGSTTADTVGGLSSSYGNAIITPDAITNAGGSISIGNGVFLSSTASNTIEATLGLGGPRLPAASTTSDPAVFSTWLNDNALVTHTQLDSIGALIRSGLNSVLFGSHHRILRDNGMTNTGNGFWVTGDFARHDPSNTDASIGEFGFYKDVTPTLRLGIGAGVNQARQDLPVNGNGKLDSSYLVLEGDYLSHTTGWTGSATAYFGSNRATISRGYMVGITPNLSNGDASGSSWALRLRGDWSKITSLSGLDVSPYLAYTYAESRLDGYTETGGTLPITLAAQKQTSNELRAGITLLSRLSEQTDLRFPLELVHRSNDSAAVTGVAAATPFSFSNAGSKQNWERIGIELDHRLNKQTVLNGAALFASHGGDSSWLGTVSLKYAF